MKNYLPLLIIIILLSSCGAYENPPAEERTLEEQLILSRANGKYLIETVEATFNIFGADGSSLLVDGKIQETPTNDYKIFKASDGKNTFYLGERNLNVKGIPNLRDLGGLFTEDGYQVKWGKIFRSGKLADVSKSEFDRLAALNLKTICDFRSDEEKEADPDKWPNIENINTIALPIGVEEGKSQKEMLKELNREDFDADDFMYRANKNFVKKSAKDYKAFFKVLLNENNYPLLFHCSAGKDRAGFGSYLILSALGVEADDRLNEYLLSNFYLQNSSEADIKKAAQFYGIDQDRLRALMKVKPVYIQGALDAIKEEYGNVQNFLCEELEVCQSEIEQLKKMMLYDYKKTYETKFDDLGVELPLNEDTYKVSYMLKGAPNFRAFNVANNDDIQLKPNKIFRSNALHDVTSGDLKKLENLNVQTIIDFRYKEEIDQDPDKKPNTLENYVNPVITRSKSKLRDLIDSTEYMALRQWFIDSEYKRVDSLLTAKNINIQNSRLQRYKSFALDFTDSYGEFMKTLTKPESFPVVYHCQGGKDRAGFASALLLKTLGYDDQTIVNDFLTTNLHTYDEVKAYYESGVKSLNHTIGAHSEHLMYALLSIDKEYGSFENYLERGLKLTEADINAIKRNLLQENSK